MLQHYGAPTRLLDFSHSLFVATYFAVAAETCADFAIWAVDYKELLRMMREENMVGVMSGIDIEDADRLNRDLIALLHQRVLLRQVMPMIFDHYYWGGRLIGVVPAEPEHHNYRLARQQGLFLVPTNLNKSFDKNLLHAFRAPDLAEDPFLLDTENLAESFKPSDEVDEYGSLTNFPLVKLVVPHKERKTFLKGLLKMGITGESLFPGLEGLARGSFEPLYAYSG